VTTVFRAPDNPLVDAVLRRLRRPGGEHIAKGTGGARHAIKLLVAGGHLGLLVDQKLNDGIAVPFFGRDAMTAPALAQFALRFDCPVVPTRVERIAGARFRITVAPPIDIPRTGERQRDVFEITRRVNEILESWIRERPEQWLWAHKRWPD
jgi:KDO2-lipid IV(A) lauroyltransferase